MTTAARTPPRWKIVFDQLQDEVRALPYGSEFYSIAQVCQKFEVSQITAIRALNELASRSLIDKIWGKGHVVRRVHRPAFIRFVIPAEAGRNLTLDPALRRRLEGITAVARALNIDFDTIAEPHLRTLFPRRNREEVFGFLLPHVASPGTVEFLREQGLAAVHVDPFEHYARVRHARTNRLAAGYLATKHLLDLGHRRIAWITGLTSRRNFRDRLRGYKTALAECRIPFRWSLVREAEFGDLDAVTNNLKDLLASRRRPTAILAGDDVRALHILDVCRRMGVRVPEQLSVVGYPNNPESRLSDPPLTVVDAQFEKVGEAAVKMLLEEMFATGEARRGVAPARQRVLIEPTLVVRGSTGPAPAARHSNAREQLGDTR